MNAPKVRQFRLPAEHQERLRRVLQAQQTRFGEILGVARAHGIEAVTFGVSGQRVSDLVLASGEHVPPEQWPAELAAAICVVDASVFRADVVGATLGVDPGIIAVQTEGGAVLLTYGADIDQRTNEVFLLVPDGMPVPPGAVAVSG